MDKHILVDNQEAVMELVRVLDRSQFVTSAPAQMKGEKRNKSYLKPMGLRFSLSGGISV